MFSIKTKLMLLILLTSFISACGTSAIDKVKNGVLNFDRTKSVGDGIEGNQFVKEVEWTSFETPQKQKIVEAKVTMHLDKIHDYCYDMINNETYFNTNDAQEISKLRSRNRDEIQKVSRVMAILQFSIYKDNESFEYFYGGLEYTNSKGDGEKKKEDVLELLMKNECPIQNYFDLVGHLLNFKLF